MTGNDQPVQPSRLTTKFRKWHRVKYCWWHENDSNAAKVVTRCGLRSDDKDTAHGVPEGAEWCQKCDPGPVDVVLVKTPHQLAALSGLGR